MSERETIRSMVAAAETIVVPSGRDYAKCVDALRVECDIDVPDFPNRLLTVQSNGQIWRMAKGKDVPLRVARGFAQVGLTGTDVLLNQNTTVTAECLRFDELGQEVTSPQTINVGALTSNVRSRYWPLGQRMCDFSLLGPEEQVDELREQLYDPNAQSLYVATSLPVLLKRFNQGRNFMSLDAEPISGSVEGAVGWLAPMAADLVETSNTIAINGLKRVEVLTDIYPAVFTCEPAPFVTDVWLRGYDKYER